MSAKAVVIHVGRAAALAIVTASVIGLLSSAAAVAESRSGAVAYGVAASAVGLVPGAAAVAEAPNSAVGHSDECGFAANWMPYH